MGKALAYDLCKHGNCKNMTVTDMDEKRVKELKNWLVQNFPDNDLEGVVLNIEDKEKVRELFQEHDTVISAVWYRYNAMLAELAVQEGCNFCDLGGNNDVVSKELALDASAKEAGVTIVPDCGLAPGMIAVLAKDAFERLGNIDTLELRVGGLPQDPTGPLNYMLIFSVHGLINEYVEPAVLIKNGNKVVRPSLDDVEELEFPEPFGKMEAFNTSGGTSTLPDTYSDRVRNLNYKTIRYLGHCRYMRALYDLGFMSSEPVGEGDGALVPRDFLSRFFERTLPKGGKDVTLLRVNAIAGERKLRYQMIDRFDEGTGLTSMMRTTSFPTSIIAQMITDGTIEKRGSLTPERCVPTDQFMKELAKRNINIEVQEML